jgi:hypothetical protein
MGWLHRFHDAILSDELAYRARVLVLECGEEASNDIGGSVTLCRVGIGKSQCVGHAFASRSFVCAPSWVTRTRKT